MADRPRPAPSRLRRELAAFVGVGLLVTVLISIGAVLVINQVARQEAMKEDERIATRLADVVVAGPLSAMLAGHAEQRTNLARLVEARLRDGSIIRIDVWDAGGQILFSDDESTIGRHFDVPDEAVAAIERGVTTSGFATAPETGPASEPVLVEVYVPLQLPDRVVAFETYFSYRTVSTQTAMLAGQIVPLAVGALVLLQLVQVPIAVSLARRVRRHEADRSVLLEQVLSVSEREREEIAADLHDGVVQDLAGVGYALGAMSLAGPPDRREITDQLGTTVRGAVDKLRRLLVDIYPPDLDGAGLPSAIGDLVEPLRDAGIVVRVDVGPLPTLSPEITAILYRTARETLINVVKHAGAATVEVSLGIDADRRRRGTDTVRLRVADDGIGPPESGVDRRSEGHLGLPMLIHRVADLGGRLTVAPGPGGGTVVEARLPAVPPGPPEARPHHTDVGRAGRTLVLPARRDPDRVGSDHARD